MHDMLQLAAAQHSEGSGRRSWAEPAGSARPGVAAMHKGGRRRCSGGRRWKRRSLRPTGQLAARGAGAPVRLGRRARRALWQGGARRTVGLHCERLDSSARPGQRTTAWMPPAQRAALLTMAAIPTLRAPALVGPPAVMAAGSDLFPPGLRPVTVAAYDVLRSSSRSVENLFQARFPSALRLSYVAS